MRAIRENKCAAAAALFRRACERSQDRGAGALILGRAPLHTRDMKCRGALAAFAVLAFVAGGCSDDDQPRFDADPAVSPDGTAVAFSRYRDGDADI